MISDDDLARMAGPNDHSRIRVKRLDDDPALPWDERHRRLSEHHLRETTFLIARIRELATAVRASR